MNFKNTPAKPQLPPPRVESIARELRALPQWVVWKYEWRGDKWTKIPYRPHDPERKADADGASSWATFKEAWETYQAGGFDGVGFEFSKSDPYFGIDLDRCLNNRVVLNWAIPFVDMLKSTFGEVSPSGEGVKFFARGKLPGEKGKRRNGMGPDGKSALEIYDHGRFFTVTGDVFGESTEIADLQIAANELYRVALEKPRRKAASNGRATRGSVATGDVQAAIAYLKNCDAAISGQAGHDKLFAATCTAGPGFNLSPETCLRIIKEIYNPRCEPPWSDYDLNHKVEDAYRVEKRRGWMLGERPAIEVSRERHIAVDAAIAALGRDPELYAKGSSLGIVVEEQGEILKMQGGDELQNAAGVSRFLMLSRAAVGCRLTKNAMFFQWSTDKNGEWIPIDLHPPGWLIDAVSTCGHWPGIRTLRTIARCPYVLEDGSLSHPGYDRVTGTLYRESVAIPDLPDRPTKDEASAAVAWLYDLVRQFPFLSNFDKAAWLAGLLTAVQRPAISGPVPGVAFIGNAPGTGKGLLIDCLGLIAFGHVIPTRSYPYDRTEAAKIKLSVALSGVAAVHFDNLDEGSEYGSGAFDSSLTSRIAEDRLLGMSRESGPVALRPVWTLSGNNLSSGKDAYRRWLPCRLVTKLEFPHERDDIEIADLRDHVTKYRGDCLQAALIILKAHAIAGRPTGEWGPLGSFEDWDRNIRGAIWYATDGVDCLVTQRRAAKESPSRLRKTALVTSWESYQNDNGLAECGATVDAVLNAVRPEPERPSACPRLLSAIMSFSKDGKLPSSTSLGKVISAMNEQVYDDNLKFINHGFADHCVMWRAVRDHTIPRRPNGGVGGLREKSIDLDPF
jgi:hypothetical protein